MKEAMGFNEWLKKKKQKQRAVILLVSIFAAGLFVILLLYMNNVAPGFVGSRIGSRFIETGVYNDNNGKINSIEAVNETKFKDILIDKQYLTPNSYSRPQDPLKQVNAVVIHYVANPGTSAQKNRDYFNGLAVSKKTFASSHYVVGIQGEIIQCLPLTEISYASNHRNYDTVSIECCHPYKSGKFSQKTYASLVSLTAALCVEFELGEDDIIRHYDVTGKLCPLYYVKHEEEWNELKDNVMKKVKLMKEGGETDNTQDIESDEKTATNP